MTLSPHILRDKALRIHYEQELGKTIRLSQWRNIKYSLLAQGDELTEDTLTNLAMLKKIIPRANLQQGKVRSILDDLKINTPKDGATLFLKCKELCSYEVTDRTIRSWFYKATSRCKLGGIYSARESKNILALAIASNPRGAA